MTISKELEDTLQRAYDLAKSKKHEFITLEHILLEMTDDPSASGILVACGVDLIRLKEDLSQFIQKNMPAVISDDIRDPQYSDGSQYVLRIAAMHVQSAGKEELMSGNLLIAMFREDESHAVYFLKEQGVDRLDIVKFISHGGTAESQEHETKTSTKQKEGEVVPHRHDHSWQADPEALHAPDGRARGPTHYTGDCRRAATVAGRAEFRQGRVQAEQGPPQGLRRPSLQRAGRSDPEGHPQV